jgi:hypothetical protein
MADKFVFCHTLAQCASRVCVFKKSVIAAIPKLHTSKNAQKFLLKAQGKKGGVAPLPFVLGTPC